MIRKGEPKKKQEAFSSQWSMKWVAGGNRTGTGTDDTTVSFTETVTIPKADYKNLLEIQDRYYETCVPWTKYIRRFMAQKFGKAFLQQWNKAAKRFDKRQKEQE